MKKDIHLVLTDEICDKMKLLANFNGSSRSAIVSDILLAFIERNDKEFEEMEKNC